MLNLEDLSQLVAFKKYGTLTKTAEQLHLSQPSITRTMKRIEEEFNVELFNRSANRIELNQTGLLAARYGEDLLNQAERYKQEIIEYDRRLHSINVFSCAPAPLWQLLPTLTRKNPDKTISSKLINNPKQVEEDFNNHYCDIAILPYPIEASDIDCSLYVEEHLSINVPKDHALAKYKEVSCEMINGYNCLLASQIGFWESFCQNKLPDSKFLVQYDEFAFQELTRQSSLPYFTTNLASDRYYSDENRVSIPITDPEASAQFYLIKRK